MKLKEKVAKAINEQINAEMWSSNLYLSMAMHFENIGYAGFAHWLKKQAAEEMEHATEMMNYLNSRGGKVLIGQIDAVPTEFDSVLEIFQKAYDHECLVSEMIEKIVFLARAEKDLATEDFFMHFVREQVEEEDSAIQIVDQIKAVKEHNYLFIDHQLAKR